MGFDPLTLLTTSTIALIMMGGLFVFLSFHERESLALRWWGAFFILGAVAIGLILSSPQHPNDPIRQCATALVIFAYGLVFAGCQTFNRRRIFYPALVIGPALWIAFCVFLRPGAATCSAVAALLLAYTNLASAIELGFHNPDRFKVQTWAARILGAHALFYASRVAFGPIGMPRAHWIEQVQSPWGAILGAETLLFLFSFGLLAIAMTRERVVQHYRKGSLEDALTNVGNRRALLLQGQAIMDESRGARRSFSVAIFDLDRFKAVNDTHGHEAGDRLLVAFASLAPGLLPPQGLFYRLGGEEFAALLPGVDIQEARAIADRIRLAVERCILQARSCSISVTVSVGLAQSTDADPSLNAVLARADHNLYRAKALGRNRIDDGSEPSSLSEAGAVRLVA